MLDPTLATLDKRAEAVGKKLARLPFLPRFSDVPECPRASLLLLPAQRPREFVSALTSQRLRYLLSGAARLNCCQNIQECPRASPRACLIFGGELAETVKR